MKIALLSIPPRRVARIAHVGVVVRIPGGLEAPAEDHHPVFAAVAVAVVVSHTCRRWQPPARSFTRVITGRDQVSPKSLSVNSQRSFG